MDNYEIADQLSLLGKLMEIHGENAFKAKSYASAAFAIEKLPGQLADMRAADIYRIRGIGESVGKRVTELLESGSIGQVTEYINRTPQGVLEMMNIKGLGPKKINTIWKELGIDTIEELEKACTENRIADKKGFGEKTQEKILSAIRFRKTSAGKYLFAQVDTFVQAFQAKLEKKFPLALFAVTGAFRRQLEIIESLEWLTTATKEELRTYLLREGVELESESDEALVFSADNTIRFHFLMTTPERFYSRLFETSCSSEFLAAWKKQADWKENAQYKSEEDIFTEAGISYLPPFMRETEEIIRKAAGEKISDVLQTSDIRGLIHSHSNWSDGSYTIEEMARALIELGFEYLVISDHSKAAFYANGLSEERIIQQHQYIDELNEKLAPFRIFKSIECDILNDGSLDYEDRILSLFDLVIVSIHSNQNMDEAKAMKRLLGAISNPYTTILGHMTGRLLLRRNGYPVDHRQIIDACVENNVVIEINANPNRLDMDWRWIEYALDRGLTLSINPDAHTIEEFQNIRYGVLVAQKGGLTPRQNLSSFTLPEFESFLSGARRKKLLSQR
ncbi:MAG TPA: helix-hairpin-helix domain-containing protein [Flavisolibacter sp.]